MEHAIKIEHLSKQYSKKNSTASYISLRDVISNAFRSKVYSNQSFYALKNINLSIAQGERIGIIGRNGAGKSTLLKILSRITLPSTGRIIINGHVSSLLEVGTGFHPELTGRENIYLNGAILGLKRSEINQKLSEIIDFSGVSEFIDMPLKHYSTGMQLRLAFSVAAHLEPEILLIDEILAVGDLEFQKKCIGKMEEINKTLGRTIIFVSHDLGAISTLTQKTIFLDKGTVQCFTNTNDAIDAYTSSGVETGSYVAAIAGNKPLIHQVRLQPSEGSDLHSFGKALIIYFDIYIPEEGMHNMALAFQIFNRQIEKPVLHQWIYDIERPVLRKKGINTLKFILPETKLYKGNYYLKVHLAESKSKVKFDEVECCYFTIDMLGIPAPEWGWYDEMCLYLEKGIWEEI